jgi:hypothetical protein
MPASARAASIAAVKSGPAVADHELELLSGMAAERALAVADSEEGEGLRLPASLLIGFMSRSEYDSADMDRLIDEQETDHGNQ